MRADRTPTQVEFQGLGARRMPVQTRQFAHDDVGAHIAAGPLQQAAPPPPPCCAFEQLGFEMYLWCNAKLAA